MKIGVLADDLTGAFDTGVQYRNWGLSVEVLIGDVRDGSKLDDEIEAPEPPVSCAALLARKMGADDMHAVVSAGLAGGIGLSGGACGALGAAIWLIEMARVTEGGGEVEFNSPEATEAIERFVQSTEGEFECGKIVGRKFAGVADHAAYLREGGRATGIGALAGGGEGRTRS